MCGFNSDERESGSYISTMYYCNTPQHNKSIDSTRPPRSIHVLSSDNGLTPIIAPRMNFTIHSGTLTPAYRRFWAHVDLRSPFRTRSEAQPAPSGQQAGPGWSRDALRFATARSDSMEVPGTDTITSLTDQRPLNYGREHFTIKSFGVLRRGTNPL